MKLVLDCFTRNWANFSGRASRKEYWLFFLFSFVIQIVAFMLDAAFLKDIVLIGLQPIIAFLFLIPGLAVQVRRLHDTNRSAWFLFIILIPVVGVIINLVFMCQKGTPGENSYGPNPLEKAEAQLA